MGRNPILPYQWLIVTALLVRLINGQGQDRILTADGGPYLKSGNHPHSTYSSSYSMTSTNSGSFFYENVPNTSLTSTSTSNIASPTGISYFMPNTKGKGSVAHGSHQIHSHTAVVHFQNTQYMLHVRAEDAMQSGWNASRTVITEVSSSVDTTTWNTDGNLPSITITASSESDITASSSNSIIFPGNTPRIVDMMTVHFENDLPPTMTSTMGGSTLPLFAITIDQAITPIDGSSSPGTPSTMSSTMTSASSSIRSFVFNTARTVNLATVAHDQLFPTSADSSSTTTALTPFATTIDFMGVGYESSVVTGPIITMAPYPSSTAILYSKVVTSTWNGWSNGTVTGNYSSLSPAQVMNGTNLGNTMQDVLPGFADGPGIKLTSVTDRLVASPVGRPPLGAYYPAVIKSSIESFTPTALSTQTQAAQLDNEGGTAFLNVPLYLLTATAQLFYVDSSVKPLASDPTVAAVLAQDSANVDAGNDGQVKQVQTALVAADPVETLAQNYEQLQANVAVDSVQSDSPSPTITSAPDVLPGLQDVRTMTHSGPPKGYDFGPRPLLDQSEVLKTTSLGAASLQPEQQLQLPQPNLQAQNLQGGESQQKLPQEQLMTLGVQGQVQPLAFAAASADATSLGNAAYSQTDPSPSPAADQLLQQPQVTPAPVKIGDLTLTPVTAVGSPSLHEAAKTFNGNAYMPVVNDIPKPSEVQSLPTTDDDAVIKADGAVNSPSGSQVFAGPAASPINLDNSNGQPVIPVGAPVIQNSVTYALVPASPPIATPLGTVADQPINANADGIQVQGQILTPNAAPVFVGGTPVALNSNNLVIGSKTQALLSEGLGLLRPTTLASIANQAVVRSPDGVRVGDHLLQKNKPAVTVAGTPVAISNNNLIIGSHTQALPQHTSYPSEVSTLATVGTQPIINSPDGVRVGDRLLQENGPAVTVDGTPISLNPDHKNIIVGGTSTIALTTATPVSKSPAAYAIAGQTVSADGPAITISGTPISLNSAGLVLNNTKTLALLTSSIVTVGSETITPAATGFSIPALSTSLTPGGAAAVLAGTTLSLDSDSALIIGSSTIALPIAIASPSPQPVINVAGAVLTPIPDSNGKLEVNGSTLTQGGPAATADGHAFALNKAGDLVVDGSHTLPLATGTSGSNGTLSALGQKFVPLGSTAIVLNGINSTLSVGGGDATINGTTIALKSEGLVVDGTTVAYATPTVETDALLTDTRAAPSGSMRTVSGRLIGGVGASMTSVTIVSRTGSAGLIASSTSASRFNDGKRMIKVDWLMEGVMMLMAMGSGLFSWSR